jgi:hypothetical protein
MNQNEAITVRIGRGNTNHPARIDNGHRVLVCGCPNTQNGHGNNACTTVAFGWSAVNCKRGASHRAAADQIVDASEASRGGKIVTSVTYADGRTVHAEGIVKTVREWLNA